MDVGLYAYACSMLCVQLLPYMPCSSFTSFLMFSKLHKLCFQYAVNKSFAEDLTEGKFSFPTIHAIKTSPNNTEIISILFTGLFSCVLCLCDNIFPPESSAVSIVFNRQDVVAM